MVVDKSVGFGVCVGEVASAGSDACPGLAEAGNISPVQDAGKEPPLGGPTTTVGVIVIVNAE